MTDLMSEDGSEVRSMVPESQQIMHATVIRRRLTLCFFLSAISTSLMSQVYPKIILLHFDGDDGKASIYRGWLATAVSCVQLVFVPALSTISDTVGRRTVIAGAFILQGTSSFVLATTPGSLIWATLFDLVTSVCIVLIPLSQAIMIDIAANGGRGATHGLGIAFGAYALATSVGDIIGGSLSEHYRAQACLVGGGMSVAAFVSLFVFGWKETAPERVSEENDEESDAETIASGDGSSCEVEEQRKPNRTRPSIVNPLYILTVFFENRLLLQIALSYFLFVLSLNVFSVGYNYLDFRFHWNPLEISYFFATFNVCMALAGGLCIRFIIPRHLSEENGALLGIFIQGCSTAVYGLCFQGWMLFPALVFGALQNITEPCLQAIMATYVAKDRQGSLQGAVTSLRIVGEGVAAPIFTHTFSAGCSWGFEQAPFFLATIFSFISLAITWWPLRKMDRALRAFNECTSEAEGSTSGDMHGGKTAASDMGEAMDTRPEESESPGGDTAHLFDLGGTVDIQASDAVAHDNVDKREAFLRGGSFTNDDEDGSLTQPLLDPSNTRV